VPIVHRKVGYRASGAPEMRALREDGAVRGDVLQLEFTPYLAHSIFQSAYSRDVFVAAGFAGPSSVVHNGVDESIFNQRRRVMWDGHEPMRVAVSTWSTDMLKGFEDYARIDAELDGRRDVVVTLYGRTRDDVRFRNIRDGGAHRRKPLARRLRSAHALLQLARWETCSNALLEGINCGLPPIFIDSGSNKEIAAEYGVEFQGSFDTALDELRERYGDLQARTRTNPYRISTVARRYLEILESVR
jgi:glycosyltransferase involved in cell wall biosynthesis